MFVTLPQFEQPMPLALVPPGSRYWRALELSMNSTWYIVTLRERHRRVSLLRNIFLSSDLELRGLVESDVASSVVALGAVVPPAHRRKRQWHLQPVRRVWARDRQGERPGDPLVIESDEGRYFDAMTMREWPENSHLCLLLELSTDRDAE